MTTYTTFQTEIKGYKYNVLVVKGKHNYVNVKKLYYSRTMGRDFANFDEATKSYKTPEFKAFLLQIELGLVNPINQNVY
jgi:hypothetical protein